MSASIRSLSRLRRFGVAAIAGAAVLALLVPIVFGSPERLVHITWRGIADGDRAVLEQRFRLDEATRVDADTWSYAPRVTTPALLRELIAHPAIADTAGIDRTALRIADNAPLTPRRDGLVTLPAGAPVAKAVALGLLVLGLGLLVAGTRGERRFQVSLPAIVRRGGRGVPVASAYAAAAFRVVFMLAVLAIVVSEPVALRDVGGAAIAEATGIRGAVVRWLAANPAVADAINPTLVVSGLLVVVGAGGRLAAGVFTAAFFLWANLLTLRVSHHAIVALQGTLIALLAARWSDAWSVDAWLVKREPMLPNRRYGYAFWIPGFVLGVAFLAAAWSKLADGPGWILNGTVKYHFVSDLDQAWVAWGPRLASVPGVAVALSAAGVAIELVVIAASFVGSPRLRTALGLLAMLLLAGFAVFQGIVWPAWWVLLLSFIPWQAFRASNPGPVVAPFPSLPQCAAVAVILVLQAGVSAAGREVPPLLSAYDMYSTTYKTPEEYEWASNLEYRVVVDRGGQWTSIDGCVVDDVIAARVREAAAASRPLPAGAAEALAACLARLPGASSVRLEGDRRVFDWDAGTFGWKRGLDLVGPIDVRAGFSRPN